MEKNTFQLKTIIENNVNIFDFNYPIFREEYRQTFEQHFIDYFYFDSIGLETVARFKHQLKVKLNLIMPYWNKMFLADELEQRILDNYDVTEVYTRTTNNELISQNTSTSEIDSSIKNKNAFTDKPMTKTSIEDMTYLSSLEENNGENNSLSTTATNGMNTGTQKEQYEYHKTGNIGVQTDADAIVKYWESLRKIEFEIFEECKDLFMLVF